MPVVTLTAVGDELLGGFTQDTNSRWLAQRLRRLGLGVKRITLVGDRHDEIVEQLRRDLADPDVAEVFCCGGLGPTPDDRTLAAVATVTGCELVVEESVRVKIERRVRLMYEAGLLESPQVGEGNLRMALIPAHPARLLENRRGMAPGLAYEVCGRRLFVLPGVPVELQSIFLDEIEPLLAAGVGADFVRELLFEFAAESRFYAVLKELETTHPDVQVGSYPDFETKVLTLRFRGASQARVEEAVQVLQARMRVAGLTARPGGDL